MMVHCLKRQEFQKNIVIKINSKKYRGKINLDLPSGNILEEGTSKVVKTDFSEVTFKRENS